MIERVRIENYKALRDITIDLTPVHVLIGPNDSGKTSVLEAIAALCRSTDHQLNHAFVGAWEGRSLVWKRQAELLVVLTAAVEDVSGAFEYSLSVRFPMADRNVVVEREAVRMDANQHEIEIQPGRGHPRSGVFTWETSPTAIPDDKRQATERVFAALAGVHYYRWSPGFLALPVAPDSKRRFRMEASGFGLALCLDDILGFDRDRFIALEQRFKAIFPQVRSIKLMPEPAFRAPADDPEQVPQLNRADGKGIYFELSERGQLVAASQVSDGMLLVLAYLTVLYLPQPPRVVLVEEPENGIHPKRLQDVLSILRDLVKEQAQSQVILTTHSPYVVDLFQPDEVTLCQKSADGSVAVRRLSESQAVREQLDVFTLGEIWTAEGDEGLARQAADVTDAVP
ncbi:MAG TPA: AAA family ATPase [Pirellulales bacterium]|nr:AAA family ATPase [Pirellulales bacterium]